MEWEYKSIKWLYLPIIFFVLKVVYNGLQNVIYPALTYTYTLFPGGFHSSMTL